MKTIRKILLLCLFWMISMEVYAVLEKTINVYVGDSFTIAPWNDVKSSYPGYTCVSTSCKCDDASAFSINEASRTKTKFDESGFYIDGYYCSYKVQAVKSGIYIIQGGVGCWKKSGLDYYHESSKILYHVTVSEKPKVVSITIPSVLTLPIGDTYTFSPVIHESGASTTLTWTSSNPSVIATNDKTITALSPGHSIITCTASNGVSAQCLVTVPINYVSMITLNETEINIEEGELYNLSAKISPDNATSKEVKWTSTNQDIAIVGNTGTVIGVSEGYCYINVEAQDGSKVQATCLVHVKKPTILASSISLNPRTAELNIGQTAQLIVTISPNNVSNTAILWSSNNSEIVSVDNDGIIQGMAEGTTTITATTTDGTELSATCVVDVHGMNLDDFDNTIYADNTDVQPGGQMVLPVKMKSTEAITGYQFDLVLPDGFSVAEEDGDYLIGLSSRTTYKKHSISYQDQADGSIRIVCTSLNNATFAELDGVVINITLNVDESVEAGDYNIIYKNVELATPALNKYKVAKWSSKVTVFDYILGDVNNDKDVSVVDAAATVNLILGVNTAGLNRKAADIDADGEISVTDAAGVVNIILGQGASVKSAPAKTRLTATADNTLTLSDFTAEAGTQQTISVGMNNTASITGIQFDLVLPEGVTVAQEDGDYLIDISTDRTTYKNHSASYQMQADGSMRVVCTSLSNKTFKENSGNVIDITLDIASSISGGSHTITLKNIELATPELEKYKPSAVSATMTVSGGAYNYIAVDNGGNNVNKSVASGDDVTINDTYQSLSVTEDIDNVNVSYSRTYKNTSWQAWYVPFGFTLTSDIASRFSFAKFAGTYTEAGQFFITLVEMQEGDEIKGNVPYFVQAKVADSSNPQVLNISNTTLYATDASGFKMLSAEKEIAIYGTYAQKVAAADDDWYAYGGGKYIKATTGQSLGAFRFYLTIRDREDNPYASTPNPIEIKVIVLGDEADGISSLNENASENGTMFNLAGQPVGAGYEGVVIKNGKKIFKK